MRILSIAFVSLNRRPFVSFCLALALFASTLSSRAGNPSLTVPVLTNSSLAQFTLNGNANYSYAIQTSTDLQNWTSVLTNRTFIYQMPVSVPATNGSTYFRALALTNAPIPYLALGLAASGNLNLNGNNCLVDSFNSALTNASTGGQYDATKALSGGDVGVNGAVMGDTNFGNGNIYGHLFTGPGSAANQVQIGPNGSVGPPGTPGGNIAPGWWSPTFNVSFPDAPAPNSPNPYIGLAPIVISGRTYLFGGTKYTWNGANNNYFNAGTLIVNGPGVSTLWVQGSMYFGNIVLTNGGSLVLYVGTTTGTNNWITDTGNSAVNQPGLARNIQIYGLHSLNWIDLHGNAGFNATVYAPEANLTVGGGGNNLQNCSGAFVAKNISLNGHLLFHYDEPLGYLGSPY
jgi:hypothetical protein